MGKTPVVASPGGAVLAGHLAWVSARWAAAAVAGLRVAGGWV